MASVHSQKFNFKRTDLRFSGGMTRVTPLLPNRMVSEEIKIDSLQVETGSAAGAAAVAAVPGAAAAVAAAAAATGEAKRSCPIYEQYVQPCQAELVGTALFVFVGCSSVIGNANGLMQPAMAHGLALAVVIQMFGKISGGHFNPAVSLSVYLCGGINRFLLLLFVAAQIVGAIIGAALAKAIYPPERYATFSGGAINELKVSSTVGGAILAEIVMTLFLTSMVCMLAVNTYTQSPFAPFSIGLTVTACILAGAPVSGACMNPARAFGPAVVANHWNYHWIYWVGPLCGSLLTACLVRLMLGDQRTRIILK